jgi:hypothetical protein
VRRESEESWRVLKKDRTYNIDEDNNNGDNKNNNDSGRGWILFTLLHCYVALLTVESWQRNI